MQPIVVYKSTHQRFLSPDLKQKNNLGQHTELCYTNEHVDIIIVHQVTLNKTKCSPSHYFEQDTRGNTVHHKSQASAQPPRYFELDKNHVTLHLSFYFEQDKHQCRQHCESFRCLKPNHFVTNCV